MKNPASRRVTSISLAEWGAAASTLAFGASALYVLGLSLRSGANVFALCAPADYARLAIGWLTPVLAGFSLSLLSNLFSSALFRREAAREAREPPKKPSKLSKWLGVVLSEPWFSSLVLVAVFVWAWQSFPQRPLPLWFLGIAGIILWIHGLDWYLSRTEVSVRPVVYALLLIVPALALFAILLGAQHAENAMRLKHYAGNHVRLHGESKNPVEGNLLVALDRYLVVIRQPDGVPVAISTESVVAVEFR